MKKGFLLTIILLCIPFRTILAQSDDSPFTDSQERCISQSVVQLQVETSEGYVSRASGVVVNPQGIIFTNAHVVESALEIQVWLFTSDGLPPVFSYFATPLLISDTLDFAILEIVADTQGNSIDTSNLQFPCFLSWNVSPQTRYAPIYIAGYPNIGGGRLTITSGIVSTEVHQSGLDGQSIKLYETDAIFATGASGGLVINNRGEFIGIPFEFRVDGPSVGQLTTFLPLSTICEHDPIACEYEPSVVLDSGFCTVFIDESNMPNGTTFTVTVEPNTFHMWASGPVRVTPPGTYLPGGPDRGNLIVMLPEGNRTTTYLLSDLNPLYNWHGAFRDCTEIERQEWIDTKEYVIGNNPDNCIETETPGCGTVTVLVLGE